GPRRTAPLLALAGAFLSKSIVMTLPGLLLLLDVYPLCRLRLGWRALLLEKWPYAAITAAGAVVAMLALRIGASASAWSQTGMGARPRGPAPRLSSYPSRLSLDRGDSPLFQRPYTLEPS